MKRKELRLEVIPATQPIDLRAWVRIVLREILTANGIPVRDTNVGKREVFVPAPPPLDNVVVAHHTVTAATRRRILDRDGEICGICATITPPFEIDHRIPVSRGGDHNDANLWVLCNCCNQDKGSMTVLEFADFLAPFGVSLLR